MIGPGISSASAADVSVRATLGVEALEGELGVGDDLGAVARGPLEGSDSAFEVRGLVGGGVLLYECDLHRCLLDFEDSTALVR